VVYLILSDIHANWEALSAVIEAAKDRYARVICCGDVVGYGADPNPVCEWMRANAVLTVRGNHDKFCSGVEPIGKMSPLASAAALWTLEQLTPENKAWLQQLPKGPVDFDGMRILHGSVRDEDEYIFDVEDVRTVAGQLGANVLFFGHTHNQGIFYCHRSGIRETCGPLMKQTESHFEVDETASWLTNPGSVGQPRDDDPRAAYALYDTSSKKLALCRVPYYISGAQRKIRAAGLPTRLADRLDLGV
jgi:predicted phosphodiesterase